MWKDGESLPNCARAFRLFAINALILGVNHAEIVLHNRCHKCSTIFNVTGKSDEDNCGDFEPFLRIYMGFQLEVSRTPSRRKQQVVDATHSISIVFRNI